jgi:para-aminobenzoate synthetase component 1
VFRKRIDCLESYDKKRRKEKLNYRVKIRGVREIKLSAEDLIKSLLEISKNETVCLLDSCGVSHLGSHQLIAGIEPQEILEIENENPEETLKILDEKLSENFAAIFTISYDFGLKLEKIKPRPKKFKTFKEPDVFLALFDSLVIHDYDTHQTFLTGNENNFDKIEKLLFNAATPATSRNSATSSIVSNFTRAEYLETVEKIKEFIRRGDTYQTNLTQQLRARLPENLTPQEIFQNLRKNHPAPFAAFLKRKEDFVISASPERFFKVESGKWKVESENHSNLPLTTFRLPLITASPIKGTRPRGQTAEEDAHLKEELLNSSKDRAENVMIVDLLRNDLGRVCEFGSVSVEKLCDLEQHPTLFHLVSTVNGILRENIKFSDLIRAVFPCGSITGAPKIRTMQIIDQLETANRGLSMGAIGYSVNIEKRKVENSEKNHFSLFTIPFSLDLSVAIRTMVVRNHEAVFNVGGGIVIDSIPENEYEESLTKALALLRSINAEI